MRRLSLTCCATLFLMTAVLAAVPGIAHAADADTPPTCEAVLAAGHEGGHEGAEASDVILHHVGNDSLITFESPLPTDDGVAPGSFSIDFRKILCGTFGWNGVVSAGSVSIDLTPTKHTFWLWIGALAVILLFLIGRPPKKGDWVPRGLYSVLEMMVLFVRDDIARENIPDREAADRYTPYLLTAFFFILTMNLLGLIPWCASATANVSVTLALAFFTFCLTQAATMRATGFIGYFKHLTGGVHWALWPIMVPVEVLGLFTKPFALTIRLFANMVAGHIVIYFLLGLIFLLKTLAVAPVSIAFAAAIYLLEIFVAFLQAFIFTLLSAIFIGLGAASGHHEDAESKGDAH